MDSIYCVWSLAMAITYGVYTWKIDWSHQCITDHLRFQPIVYATIDDVKQLLKSPGA